MTSFGKSLQYQFIYIIIYHMFFAEDESEQIVLNGLLSSQTCYDSFFCI